MKYSVALLIFGVISAFTVISPGSANGQSVARLQALSTGVSFPFSSGSLDSTFGSSGTVAMSPGSNGSVAQAVAVQADGKVVVAGYAFNGVINEFATSRMNPDGSPDTTFDGDGAALTRVGPLDAEAFGIAIQNDKKIVLAGQSWNGSHTDVAIVRYNEDGTIDNTFAVDGRFVLDIRGGNDIARSVTVQQDGKIVIAGNALLGSNFDIVLVRLNADGSLDQTFNGNSGTGRGVITTAVGSGNDLGYAVVLRPDGRILVSGYYSGPSSTDSVVLQYNAAGVLDTTFSSDGIAAFAFSQNDVDEALAMSLTPDGRIVVAGCIRGSGRLNDYLIARLKENGDLDPAFGNGGVTIVQFSANPDIALGVAVQSDGKIVAAGFASNGVNNDFGVTRVNSDGSLDSNFNGDGRTFTAFGLSVEQANAVAIQADGKIVVVGRALVNGMANFGVARYGYGSNEAQDDGFIDLDMKTSVRFDNAFVSGISRSFAVDPAMAPRLGDDWRFADSPRSIETTALFSGDVIVRLKMPEDTDPTIFRSIRILQDVQGLWVDKTIEVPLRDFSSRVVFASVSTTGVLAAAFPVVSVSGRVTTPSGLGLRNATITLTDGMGVRRTATTSSFGNYIFTDVPGGQQYTVSVSSKRYRFPSRPLQTSASVTNFDFVGLE